MPTVCAMRMAAGRGAIVTRCSNKLVVSWNIYSSNCLNVLKDPLSTALVLVAFEGEVRPSVIPNRRHYTAYLAVF